MLIPVKLSAIHQVSMLGTQLAFSFHGCSAISTLKLTWPMGQEDARTANHQTFAVWKQQH